MIAPWLPQLRNTVNVTVELSSFGRPKEEKLKPHLCPLREAAITTWSKHSLGHSQPSQLGSQRGQPATHHRQRETSDVREPPEDTHSRHGDTTAAKRIVHKNFGFWVAKVGSEKLASTSLDAEISVGVHGVDADTTSTSTDIDANLAFGQKLPTFERFEILVLEDVKNLKKLFVPSLLLLDLHVQKLLFLVHQASDGV
ncbi:hypothetical protein Taro_036641 [Colocasia esculenta]|uniref:Uncharacterized protein n=1 Tax=Colocasia esculenta TaxID=4460 RepID=A0A843WM91_COLES|nr:hypothetical protein [Colocasia esculenta]